MHHVSVLLMAVASAAANESIAGMSLRAMMSNMLSRGTDVKVGVVTGSEVM